MNNKKAPVPLANRFKGIDAVTIVDILQRAGSEVTTSMLKEKIVGSGWKKL